MLLTAPPAVEPVALDEAKAWLRLQGGDDDDLVRSLLVSARLLVEAQTRRLLVTQGWRLTFDAWPATRRLHLPLTPFQGLGAIAVASADGTMQALSPALYELDPAPLAPRLCLAPLLPAPGRELAGISIDVTAGYGSAPADVPAPLRQAILMLAARWFENRGDAPTDTEIMPAAIDALILPFRARRLR